MTENGRGICNWCGKEGKRINGHIIPKFVWDYMKQTGGTPYLRGIDDINKRLQDGPTERLLCKKCDERLGGWEGKLAEEVFKPLQKGNKDEEIDFRKEAELACIGILWKISKVLGRSERMGRKIKEALDAEAERWKEYLEGEGAAEQHPEVRFWRLDEVREGEGWPEGSNRYMLRGVGQDIEWRGNGARLTVWAKMGRILAIGYVRGAKRFEEGSEGGQGGTGWGGEQQRRPEWVNVRIQKGIEEIEEKWSKMSPRSKRLVERAVEKDLQRVLNSEMYDAQIADANATGWRTRIQTEGGERELPDGELVAYSEVNTTVWGAKITEWNRQKVWWKTRGTLLRMKEEGLPEEDDNRGWVLGATAMSMCIIGQWGHGNEECSAGETVVRVSDVEGLPVIRMGNRQWREVRKPVLEENLAGRMTVETDIRNVDKLPEVRRGMDDKGRMAGERWEEGEEQAEMREKKAADARWGQCQTEIVSGYVLWTIGELAREGRQQGQWTGTMEQDGTVVIRRTK